MPCVSRVAEDRKKWAGCEQPKKALIGVSALRISCEEQQQRKHDLLIVKSRDNRDNASHVKGPSRARATHKA